VIPKPHIYLNVYPSGFKFWRVRRARKKHSRMRDDERSILKAAYAFVAKLNKDLDKEYAKTCTQSATQY
jgi:hypothetical protein